MRRHNDRSKILNSIHYGILTYRNKDNKLNRDLSKPLKNAETTDEQTKLDQKDTQITQEGSKEDLTTLKIEDEYRKEIKRNEEITRSMKSKLM
jgi:hypothetical protein